MALSPTPSARGWVRERPLPERASPERPTSVLGSHYRNFNSTAIPRSRLAALPLIRPHLRRKYRTSLGHRPNGPNHLTASELAP